MVKSNSVFKSGEFHPYKRKQNDLKQYSYCVLQKEECPLSPSESNMIHILHTHQSPHVIYAIFCITTESDLMTFFVLQLSTQSPVSHDWKSFVLEFSKCSVMLLPIFNMISVLLMPEKDGKLRDAL